MAQTTWEEASRCRKCDQPGVEVAVKDAAERFQGKVHIIECQNELCINFNERWIVQVRPDGTIPIRDESTRGFQSFPRMSESQQAMARRQLEDLQQEERRNRG